MFGLLALYKVGTATDALLLGTRESRVPIIRIEVFDLLRAFIGHRHSLNRTVVIVEHLVHGNAAVVAFVRVRLAIIGRNPFEAVMALGNTAVMVHHVRMALELGNTVMVVVAVDAPAVHARVTKNGSLPGVRARHAVRNTVVDRRSATLPAGTIREVVGTLVLMDVRRFEHLALRQVVHLHVRAVAHRGVLGVVQLHDVEVVGIRAAIAFATAPRNVGGTVVIDKDTRVKAPRDAIAADKAAAANKLGLAVTHGIFPRSIDRRGLDITDTAATAIGEDDIERAALGVHGDTGSPNSANAVYLTGIVNNAEVGPVLHILAAETVQGVNLVVRSVGRCRVIGVRDDVEILIVGGSTRVSQVMVC